MECIGFLDNLNPETFQMLVVGWNDPLSSNGIPAADNYN